MTTAPPDSEAGLRLLRFADQMSAFGLAISYLMAKPAFQGLPFGHWAQTVAGQINRDHYVFACRGETVVGFAGWAFASLEEAEAWLADEPGASATGGDEGPCLIINCWAVDSPEANQLLRDQMRKTGRNRGPSTPSGATKTAASGDSVWGECLRCGAHRQRPRRALRRTYLNPGQNNRPAGNLWRHFKMVNVTGTKANETDQSRASYRRRSSACLARGST